MLILQFLYTNINSATFPISINSLGGGGFFFFHGYFELAVETPTQLTLVCELEAQKGLMKQAMPLDMCIFTIKSSSSAIFKDRSGFGFWVSAPLCRLFTEGGGHGLFNQGCIDINTQDEFSVHKLLSGLVILGLVKASSPPIIFIEQRLRAVGLA